LLRRNTCFLSSISMVNGTYSTHQVTIQIIAQTQIILLSLQSFFEVLLSVLILWSLTSSPYLSFLFWQQYFKGQKEDSNCITLQNGDVCTQTNLPSTSLFFACHPSSYSVFCLLFCPKSLFLCWFVFHFDRGDMCNVVEQSKLLQP
jgi:hypothetical protein